MSEEQLFNKLRQTPILEVIELLDKIKRPTSQLLNMSDNIVDSKNYYHNMTHIIEKVKLLNKHGWDIEEFQKELEKMAIISLVDDFNAFIRFPQELIDRAKIFFPNVKFNKASIELE